MNSKKYLFFAARAIRHAREIAWAGQPGGFLDDKESGGFGQTVFPFRAG